MRGLSLCVMVLGSVDVAIGSTGGFRAWIRRLLPSADRAALKEYARTNPFMFGLCSDPTDKDVSAKVDSIIDKDWAKAYLDVKKAGMTEMHYMWTTGQVADYTRSVINTAYKCTVSKWGNIQDAKAMTTTGGMIELANRIVNSTHDFVTWRYSSHELRFLLGHDKANELTRERAKATLHTYYSRHPSMKNVLDNRCKQSVTTARDPEAIACRIKVVRDELIRNMPHHSLVHGAVGARQTPEEFLTSKQALYFLLGKPEADHQVGKLDKWHKKPSYLRW